MRRLLLIFAPIIFGCTVYAQQAAKPDDNYLRPYYVQRASLSKMLPKIKNAIVFLGDSITDGGEWAEGLEVLRDGTIVTTTYGHWVANDPAYIMSVRLKLSELDKKYQVIAKKQHE